VDFYPFSVSFIGAFLFGWLVFLSEFINIWAVESVKGLIRTGQGRSGPAFPIGLNSGQHLSTSRHGM
jgi:hypothetical protein